MTETDYVPAGAHFGTLKPLFRCRGLVVGRGQLHQAAANAGIEAGSFKAGRVEGVDADMGVVHGFLSAKGHGINELVAFVDVDRGIGPVGQDIVAGDPDQALVAGDRSQMPGYVNKS